VTSKLALIKGKPVRLQTARRAARVRSVSNTTLSIPVQVTSIYRYVYAIACTGGFYCDVPTFYTKTLYKTVSNKNVALPTCSGQLTNAPLQDFCTYLEFCFVLFMVLIYTENFMDCKY
jgi:hypothetical protein